MSDDLAGWPALLDAAADRGGVVTLRDARRHGVPDRTFRDRAAREAWLSLGAGSWLLPGRRPDARTVHHAALQVFPNGLLSHDTALDLLGLRPRPAHDPRVHVVVPYDSTGLPPAGSVRHRSRRLDDVDRTEVDGLRTTTAARAIMDVAARLPRWRLEALVLAARQRRLMTLDQLRDQVARRPTLHGVGRLRSALDTVGESGADSILEHRCRRLLVESDVPVSDGPIGVVTPGGRLLVDMVVGDRVAVECDGFAYHSSRRAFERDRQRWRLLREAGWSIVWVTWTRLHDDPVAVVDEVRRALASGRP